MISFSNTGRLFSYCILNSRVSWKYGFSMANDILKAGIKKSVEELVGAPKKPKRPNSPFLSYFYTIRSQLLSQYPDASFVERLRKASELWKNLEPQSRNKYETEFNTQFAEFTMKMSAYDNNLSDEQRDALKNAKQLINEKRKARKIKREAIQLGKPRKPASSFGIYVKECVGRRKITKDDFVELAKTWREMDDSEKEKYRENCKAVMQKYAIDMFKWEEKMIQEGRTHLLRTLSRIDTLQDLKTSTPQKGELSTPGTKSLKTQKKKSKSKDTLPLDEVKSSPSDSST